MLLELFSVVDDVFTEPDALAKKNVYKTAGRIYRAWKKARKQMDPDFKPERYRQSVNRKAVQRGLSVIGKP